MTKDDIIRMASKAGIYHAFDSEGHWDGLTDVQLIERHPPHPSDIVYGEKRTVEILERFATFVAKEEREACAQLVEDFELVFPGLSRCGNAIRARGQQ